MKTLVRLFIYFFSFFFRLVPFAARLRKQSAIPKFDFGALHAFGVRRRRRCCRAEMFIMISRWQNILSILAKESGRASPGFVGDYLFTFGAATPREKNIWEMGNICLVNMEEKLGKGKWC